MTQRKQSGIPDRLDTPFHSLSQNHWQRLNANNKAAKGFTSNAKPFKATGHKGGISRQGSKRG